jgi:transcriptional regulator with XRE-family HTH domain
MGNLLEGCNTSEKIRALMASRRVTQTEMGELLGVSQATIINRFADNRWDVKELEAIAAKYGVDKSDLI